MISVAALILHFKNLAMTEECLASLARSDQTGLKLAIIVVNNGAPEPFAQRKIGSLSVNIITNEKNLGYAAGNNVAIRAALKTGASYIWILNNDTLVAGDCLKLLVAAAEREKDYAVLGPKIYFAPGFEFHKNRCEKKDQGRVIWWAGGRVDMANIQAIHEGIDEVDKGQFNVAAGEGSILQTSFIPGTAMLVRREIFDRFGLFDERYYLYLEDMDFCLRVLRAQGRRLWARGSRLGWVPKAVIWHKNAGSSGSGSELHDYYLTRNRLLFGFHFAPLRTKLALIRESGRLLLSGRKWQRKGVWDYYLGRLGQGSYQS